MRAFSRSSSFKLLAHNLWLLPTSSMTVILAPTRSTKRWIIGTCFFGFRLALALALHRDSHTTSEWPYRSAHDDNRQRRLGPNVGAIRALILLIRFPEHSQRQLPTPEQIKAVCEGPVAQYMSQQSYGQYTLTGCDAYDWVEADKSEAYYSYNKYGRGITNEELQPLLYPALNSLDQVAAASNPSFWQQYDSDGDSAIDIVFGVHSGFGSEFGMTDCETGREPVQRIQSQAWNGIIDSGWVSSQETGLYSLQGYVVIHALELACGNTTLKPGKMAHEMTHTFVGSPPDLYDQTVGGAGVGGYDIMSSAYGPTQANGDAPGSMSPWMKVRTSWIDPEEIIADGTYSMRPSTLYPDYYVIRSGFPDQEYLLLEYRTNATGGFEADFYGAGMVIYHADDTIDLNRKIGYPGQTGWPSNGNLYMLSVLQADGLYDIEKKVNPGDSGDLWTAGMSIGPASTNKYPNTDSLRGGVATPTGITITVLSVDSSQLSFQVSGVVPTAPATLAPAATPGVPTSTSPPVLAPVMSPTLVATSSAAPVVFVPLQPSTAVPMPTTLPPNTGLPTTVTPTVSSTVGPTIMREPTVDGGPSPTIKPSEAARPVAGSSGGGPGSGRNSTESPSTSSAIQTMPVTLVAVFLAFISSYAML